MKLGKIGEMLRDETATTLEEPIPSRWLELVDTLRAREAERDGPAASARRRYDS
jgi:hypothetical protein